MRVVWSSMCVLALVGCREGQRGFNVGQDAAEQILGPKVDRCTRVKAEDRPHCDELKETARAYIRGLNVNDNICVEGGFGDEPGPNCKARGQVIDANNQGVLVKIHDPQPGTHWQGYSDRNIWIENAALVDQYLADRGYE